MPLTDISVQDAKLRSKIATNVLLYGVIALGILAIIIIIAVVLLYFNNNSADKEKGMGYITGIFYSLLPVVAAWVGTVIAFYFGKENLDNATQSVQALVQHITNSDQKLQSTKVTDPNVMRLFAEITYNKQIIAKGDPAINLQTDIINFFDSNLKDIGDRLPIIDSNGLVRYIIHESLVNQFVRKLSVTTATSGYPKLFVTNAPKLITQITLDDLINNTDQEINNKIINSVTYVSKNSTLYDVNLLLVKNPNSQDAFVTETGNAKEPVIGWITNNKVAEMAKL